MNKNLVLFFIVLTLMKQAVGQRLTKEFQLSNPEAKVANSFYHYIEVIDSRFDTSNYGIVQRGAFNRKARVIANPDIATQLNNAMKLLLEETAQNDTLLLQFRHFSFAEITGAFDEKGYCYLRMELYEKKGFQYYKIALLDTLLITSSFDVTNQNLRKGSNTIFNFISQNLTKRGNREDSFTKMGLEKIDSIEKSKLVLYNSPKLNDGLYYTYNSFKNQIPDSIVNLELNQEESEINFKIVNQKGKKIKLKTKNLYALVTNGDAYVSTDYGFYQLTKIQNDFHFIGRANANAKTSNVVMAGVLFGVFGTALASNASGEFEMKIDQNNGSFIRLKEIE